MNGSRVLLVRALLVGYCLALFGLDLWFFWNGFPLVAFALVAGTALLIGVVAFVAPLDDVLSAELDDGLERGTD